MFIENTGELTHEIDLGGYVIRLYHLPDNSVTRLTASLGVAASDLQGLSYAIGETYVQAGPRPTVEMWMTFSYGLEEVNLMPGTVCWDRMRSGVHPGTIEKPELSVGLYIMKARFGSIDTGVIAEGYAVFEVGLPKDQVAQPIRQAASCTREIGQATGERLSA